jgi:hypothetical protein
MSRLPPTLLYLTVYNPTLKPGGPIADDDEDAEEQAHILFYASRERAVSRDKMLRQLGLAKALVNFSEYAVPTSSLSLFLHAWLTISGTQDVRARGHVRQRTFTITTHAHGLPGARLLGPCSES